MDILDLFPNEEERGEFEAEDEEMGEEWPEGGMRCQLWVAHLGSTGLVDWDPFGTTTTSIIACESQHSSAQSVV